MDKGERTKQRIIAQSAPLFNVQGYAGTSMGDVMQVTGLQKGGVYRHFKSKDDLALAAFDFAFARTKAHFAVAIRENAHTVQRLLAIIQAHADLLDDPLLAGGCPILNTAVESDDTHPELRRRAQAALAAWLEMLRITLGKGIARGEMKEVAPGKTP